MTQGERIKELRKSLSFTLEKFGQQIGVGKSTISDLENGRRSLSEHMTKSICREFGVDYTWLTTGEGEMFIETDRDFMARIDRIMAGESDVRKNMIKTLLYASEDDIAAFGRLVNDYAALKNESIPTADAAEAAEAEYIKSRSASAQSMTSSASNTTDGTENKAVNQ